MQPNKPTWQSTVIGLAFILLVGAIFLVVYLKDGVDPALKAWAGIGTLVGVVVGAVPTYFFGQAATTDARKLADDARADAADARKEASDSRREGSQANAQLIEAREESASARGEAKAAREQADAAREFLEQERSARETALARANVILGLADPQVLDNASKRYPELFKA